MKEKIFNISKYLIFATAIIQLALSQVHIGVITKAFEPAIGFFLFLYTIFSVLMAFNASSYQHGQRVFLVIAGTLAATFFGVFYLSEIFADISMGKILTFEIAKNSIYTAGIAIGVYVIFTPIMLISGYLNDKE